MSRAINSILKKAMEVLKASKRLNVPKPTLTVYVNREQIKVGRNQ